MGRGGEAQARVERGGARGREEYGRERRLRGEGGGLDGWNRIEG